MNEQAPRVGLAGSARVEYPPHWPQATITRLETNPRWKRYYQRNPGETIGATVTGMLNDWNVQFNCLITLLKLIRWFNGKSPYSDQPDGEDALQMG